MSLYYEAAGLIDDLEATGRSLKHVVYQSKTLKSPPGALYALLSQSSLWSPILSEIIDKTALIDLEKRLTPALAVLLTHDLLLAKKGIATNKAHPLCTAISKHKARLSAELTKERIRRRCHSIDALEADLRRSQAINNGEDEVFTARPRWFRINTLKVTPQKCLEESFPGFERVDSLSSLKDTKALYLDHNIPNLVGVHSSLDLTKTTAYRDGYIILQDKASCFPAYLLDPSPGYGRVIDGCAAPGNKTTHLAAILNEKQPIPTGARLASSNDIQVTACERAKDRAQTLQLMVRRAGADKLVEVRAGQDFLQLDPLAKEWQDVTAILLDPSCSGSGIVGRDDGESDDTSGVLFRIVLPKSSGQSKPSAHGKGKKRKRGENGTLPPAFSNGDTPGPVVKAEGVVTDTDEHGERTLQLRERLRALSAFQLKLLKHAFCFPNAKRITYSTCSVHGEENELVVIKALTSNIAIKSGWRIMRRSEQVDGLQQWNRRGDAEVCLSEVSSNSAVNGLNADEIGNACIRCAKGTDEGTMGFFVAGFVRAGPTTTADVPPSDLSPESSGGSDEEGEWQGFSD